MKEHRLGNCYELAGNAVLSHGGDGLRLVHGTISRDKVVNPHAWLRWQEEDVDWVWEPVMDESMPTVVFERLFGATWMHEYDVEAASKLLLETKNYGPWEGDYWQDERQKNRG